METKEDLENMVYQLAFEMKELRQDLKDAEKDIRRIKHQVYVVMRGPKGDKGDPGISLSVEELRKMLQEIINGSSG